MIGCLVIHGYTGGPHEVKPLIEHLQKYTTYDIQAPTLPGHGEPLALDNISYEKWIQAAETSFEQLKTRTDRIFVIGFSMGGMIAAYLAAKFKVDKLVLLATAGKYLSFPQLSRDVGDVIKDSLTGKIKDNKLFQHYKTKIGEVPLKANIEFMRLVRFTRKHLKDVEVPVLIAQGHLDGLVPYKTAYYLADEIQSDHKEVVMFDESKHHLCLGDDKDTLNSMIYKFLTSESKEKRHTLE